MSPSWQMYSFTTTASTTSTADLQKIPAFHFGLGKLQTMHNQSSINTMPYLIPPTFTIWLLVSLRAKTMCLVAYPPQCCTHLIAWHSSRSWSGRKSGSRMHMTLQWTFGTHITNPTTMEQPMMHHHNSNSATPCIFTPLLVFFVC